MALRRGIWLELYAVQQLFGQVVTRALEHDEAGREFAIYSALLGLERATPSTMAQTLGLALTTASDQLNRMVARRHATREVDPDDRRSHVFSLTEEGERVTRAHFESFGAMARSVSARLDLPVDDIRRALRELERAFREELDAEAPKP